MAYHVLEMFKFVGHILLETLFLNYPENIMTCGVHLRKYVGHHDLTSGKKFKITLTEIS